MNRLRRTTSAVLFAAALGFHSQAFFDLGEERATVSATPQVKF